MYDIISQIVIAILGVGALILIERKNKWGFVLGLLVQPFWYITTYINQQWGVFFLNFVYTAVYAFGIYEWFYKNRSQSIWRRLLRSVLH